MMSFREFEEQQSNWNLEFERSYKEWEKRWENLVIPERHIREIHLAIDKLALKYGWVSDWGHFTPAEIDDLLKEWSDTKLFIEDQEEKISNYFIEYYSAHNFNKIEDCITKWIQNSIFNRRMPIFRDCLFALQNSTKSFNPSNLVVPVLFSQIDGIIGELCEREGLVFSVKEKRWIHPNKPKIKNLEKTSDKVFGNMIKNKRNRFGSTYFSNLIQLNSRYEVLIEGLFQSAYHGTELTKPSFLSRHKILHGEDIEYGNLSNTIKLFLILDYLSKFTAEKLTEPDDSTLVEYRKPSSLINEKNKSLGIRGFSPLNSGFTGE
jgi:hypothetical protein